MKNSKSKVIVTGGAGFIGSHLADALVAKGYETHVIDNLSGGKRQNVNTKAVFHEIDIRDTKVIADIIKGADCVFHCAALPRVQRSIQFPQETNEVNVNGTLSVLMASKDAQVRRVIYSSSSSIYGDQKVLPLSEDLIANPKSPYGLQKYIGELYAKVFSDVYGLSTVSLRYFSVYGPRFNLSDGPYSLVIGKFIEQRLKRKPLTITGDGSQTRDFTHVSDIVVANLLAMESQKVGEGEAINIGAGNNISINHLSELIGGPVEYIEARLEPHDTKASNNKAKELLGWVPTVPLEEGIAELKKSFGIQN